MQSITGSVKVNDWIQFGDLYLSKSLGPVKVVRVDMDKHWFWFEDVNSPHYNKQDGPWTMGTGYALTWPMEEMSKRTIHVPLDTHRVQASTYFNEGEGYGS